MQLELLEREADGLDWKIYFLKVCEFVFVIIWLLLFFMYWGGASDSFNFNLLLVFSDLWTILLLYYIK